MGVQIWGRMPIILAAFCRLSLPQHANAMTVPWTNTSLNGAKDNSVNSLVWFVSLYLEPNSCTSYHFYPPISQPQSSSFLILLPAVTLTWDYFSILSFLLPQDWFLKQLFLAPKWAFFYQHPHFPPAKVLRRISFAFSAVGHLMSNFPTIPHCSSYWQRQHLNGWNMLVSNYTNWTYYWHWFTISNHSLSQGSTDFPKI